MNEANWLVGKQADRPNHSDTHKGGKKQYWDKTFCNIYLTENLGDPYQSSSILQTQKIQEVQVKLMLSIQAN